MTFLVHISNLVPNSLATFDPSRHLTPDDISVSKHHMRVRLKWSKTLHNRDRVDHNTLPWVKSSTLSPVFALQKAVVKYSSLQNDPLFQINIKMGWVLVTESRKIKCLALSVHSFWHSEATLSDNTRVPIQRKHHGS